jgi:hypothetical protein
MVEKTKPPMVMSYFKIEEQSEQGRILCATPNRGNFINLHKRLVPTQGRKSRQDGGVAEKSNGPISGPAEGAPSKHTQLPIELLAK